MVISLLQIYGKGEVKDAANGDPTTLIWRWRWSQSVDVGGEATYRGIVKA